MKLSRLLGVLPLVIKKSEKTIQKSSSLSKQLTQKVLLLSLIGILGLSSTISLSLQLTLRQVQRRLDQVSLKEARTIDEFFLKIKSDLVATSASLATSNNISEVLRQMLARNLAFLDLILISPDGKVLVQQSRVGRIKQKIIEKQPWQKLPRLHNQIYIGSVNFEQQFPSVDIAVDVTDEIGITVATLVAKVDLTELLSTIFDIKVGSTGYVYITNAQGQLIAYRNGRLVGKDITLKKLLNYTPQKIVEESPLFLGTGLSGKPVFASGQLLEVVPWYAIVEQPVYEALAPFIVPSAILLAILLFASWLVYSIIHFTRDRIALPLLSLSDAVGCIASAQLDQQLEVKHNDELGILAQSFNGMAAQLKESFEELENRVQQRTAELKQAKEIADTANHAKSQFLAHMSHELRNPLNAILGFTQLLKWDSSLNSEQQENLDIISRSGEHLLELINDVLEMSKIEAGHITLNETEFDLYRLLANLEETLRLKAVSKGLQLIFILASNLPQYVKTDERKLRQVLINLLGNAIKFTHSGSVSLRVKLESEKDSFPSLITFEVKDTGFGIAPTELETLFEPFVQTETGRKSGQGTGLGLAISRKFVELMGGDITVSSRKGEGTVFKFTLPVCRVETPVLQTPQLSRRTIALAASQPQYRILVVDDRSENRQLLLKLLKPIGFAVREATNGTEAVTLWQDWKPHLIWMDLRMSVMDGYEATRKIKSDKPGTKATVVIALTASAFAEERSKALSAGCDDFVTKPFSESVILAKISEHLGVSYITVEENLVQTHLQQEQRTDFNGMSPEWMIQLHEAAIRASDQQIFQLIEQIPQDNQQLAQTLTDLVNKFRYDLIISSTQKAENESCSS